MLEKSHLFVPGCEYYPLSVDRDVLLKLNPDDVYMQPSSTGNTMKFYRNMISELHIKACKNCNKFFHRQAWHKEVLLTRCCPFCGAPDGERIPTQC